MSHGRARSVPIGALLADGGAFAVPVALGYLFAAIVIIVIAQLWKRAVIGA